MKEKKQWIPKRILEQHEHFDAGTYRITGDRNRGRLFEANEKYQKGESTYEIWEAFNKENMRKITFQNFEKLCEYYDWFINQGGQDCPKERQRCLSEMKR